MFYPMFFMFLLTFFIALVLLKTRVASVKNREVSIKYYRAFQGEEHVPDFLARASRSFTNMFEVPTLFYVVSILFLQNEYSSIFSLVCAWTFVSLRYLHAYIHLTYNNVIHRMMAFFGANIFLVGLWVELMIFSVLQ